MLSIIIWPLYAALLLPAVPQSGTAETAARQSLTGSWQASNGDTLELVLDENSESIRAKQQHDSRVLMEYTCGTDGKDCEFHEEGHKGKVSLWFNVPYLVEMRTHGAVVTKRRFLVKDGTLQVEVMPISPAGKTELVSYSRAKQAAGH